MASSSASSRWYVLSENALSREASSPAATSLSETEAVVSRDSSSLLHDLDSLVQSQLSIREREYTDHRIFHILCATWNVNGKPCSEDLSDWLRGPASPALASAGHKKKGMIPRPPPPDVYAIGFQELDLSTEVFLFTESPKEEEWFNACLQAITVLHPSISYTHVKSIRLIGIMLIIFVRQELTHLISNTACESVGTGLLGRMGNKGGVGVRFDLCNTSFCFICSHLAAHHEEVDRRNQDYNEINNRLIFTQCKPFSRMIADHDQVYWFGDLNYRLACNDSESVKNRLAIGDLDSLLREDQLMIELSRRPRKVFTGYQEGKIMFQPTYKYDVGGDSWDSSEKSRPPAWTDRVLWSGGPSIRLLSYTSHPSLRLSDHKPVTALFESTVKVIDSVRYRQVVSDIVKRQDKLENEFLPQVSLDRTEVSFDRVTLRQSCVRHVRVTNTGQKPVVFSFIKKPGDQSICQPWLRIRPLSQRIDQGQHVDVALEILVDEQSAACVTDADGMLSDILVMHLEHGRDLFITITAHYSLFGDCFD